MANSTAEIPSVEEVITSATRTSDVSTIVSETLERRSSNSSAAAFSPFIVADVKEVNDIPEVTMTQSVYSSLRAADIPAPPITPLSTEDLSTLDTSAPLPESTESSIDEPVISISHRPLEIGEEYAESDNNDTTNDSDSATDSDSDGEDAGENSEHSDADAAEAEAEAEAESEADDDNSVHSQDEEHTPKAQLQALEAQIPAEIMFLLFVVLILNSFNFLLSLTGARQCIRPL